MKKSEIAILFVILLSFAIGIYIYPQMPQIIASHWNIQGQVDGYMPRFWGVFLMPIITLGMYLLFILVPKIDPLRKNINKFRKYFDNFIFLIILFLFYVYLLTIIWNKGVRFNMSQMIVPSLGIIFYYSGVLIENTKRNWFIGIRTPWTLSSDSVWERTHKKAGILFKIAGIIALLGIIFHKYAFLFIFFPIILVTIYTIVYSYIEYQKEKHGSKRRGV